MIRFLSIITLLTFTCIGCKTTPEQATNNVAVQATVSPPAKAPIKAAKVPQKPNVTPTKTPTPAKTKVASGGKITLEPSVLPFGAIDPQSKHSGEFTLTNTGDGDIEITKIVPTCGCTLLKWHKNNGGKRNLTPGESLKLPFTYTAKKKPGKKRKTIKVETFDGKDHETISLIFTSEVIAYLTLSESIVTFSLATPDEKPTITITSNEKPFKINNVFIAKKAVKCDFAKDISAMSHTLTFKGDAKGLSKSPTGIMTVHTSHPITNNLSLTYNTKLLYSAKPAKKYFSRIATGKSVNAITTIVSADHSDFELGEITSTNKLVNVTSTEKLKRGGYKIKYTLTCPSDQKKGRIKGKLIIKIKDTLNSVITFNISGNVK